MTPSCARRFARARHHAPATATAYLPRAGLLGPLLPPLRASMFPPPTISPHRARAGDTVIKTAVSSGCSSSCASRSRCGSGHDRQREAVQAQLHADRDLRRRHWAAPDEHVKIAVWWFGKVTGIRCRRPGQSHVQVDGRVQCPSDSYASTVGKPHRQRYVYLYAGKASTMLSDGDGFDDHCRPRSRPAARRTSSTSESCSTGGRCPGPRSAKANQFLDTITQPPTATRPGRQSHRRSGHAGHRLAARTRHRSLIENLNTVAGTINVETPRSARCSTTSS